jgi:hypothetical protein
MKSSVLIFLSTLVAANVQCGLSFASRDCTQGPDCEQLNESIKQIKDVKSKRHQDVRQYGKDSSQVKNDDLVLTQAVQKDHELRADRKQAVQSSGKHHGKHRQSKPHQKSVTKPVAKSTGSQSPINLTQF